VNTPNLFFWVLLAIAIAIFSIVSVVKPLWMVQSVFAWTNFVTRTMYRLHHSTKQFADYPDAVQRSMLRMTKLGGVFGLLWVAVCLFFLYAMARSTPVP
jgi:hypothetical protein